MVAGHPSVEPQRLRQPEVRGAGGGRSAVDRLLLHPEGVGEPAGRDHVDGLHVQARDRRDDHELGRRDVSRSAGAGRPEGAGAGRRCGQRAGVPDAGDVRPAARVSHAHAR